MTIPSVAQTDDPYTTYSPTNIICYFQNPSQYYRIDYQWYLKNTGQNSITYYNGNVYGNDTGGTADIGYFDALPLFPTNLTQIPFAIIDSGINLSHPEFTNLLAIGNTADLTDPSGHGTCVGGVILAKRDGVGIQSIGSDVPSIIFAKVSYRSTDEISTAIRWCVTNNAKIINLAWGTAENNVGLANAITYAQQNGVVIVAAAPNVDQNVDVSPDYPSSWKFDNVVSVTSVTRAGTKYSPAAWGATTVHLGAPGRVIPTTGLNPLYVYNSGTSMASPFVTMALTLIANKYPYQSYHYWIERLLKGVIPNSSLIGNTISGGRLNLVEPLKEDPIGVFLSFDRLSGMMAVTVTNGFNSGIYKLQSCTNLASCQWVDIELIENGNSYYFYPTNPMMFFRAKLLDYEVPPIPPILSFSKQLNSGGHIKGTPTKRKNANIFLIDEKKVNNY